MQIPIWLAVVLVVAFVLAIPVFILAALGVQLLTQRATQRRAFPLEVPGWGVRVSSPCPWPLEALADMLSDLVIEWRRVHPEHSERKIRKQLRGNLWRLVRAEGHERYVTDRWGRKLAGYHDGDESVVAYLPDDEPGDTALSHENCHELDEMNGGGRNHRDLRIWGEDGDGFDPAKDDPNGVVQRVADAHR